jgi:tetratricopeptide (TPR) repeat protein
MSSQFSDDLARRMRERKVSVRGLARESGYSAGHISNLRNGTKQPSPECAADLDFALSADGALTALARDTAADEAPAAAPARYGESYGGVPLALPDEVSPVEHFSAFRLALAQQDNLFGPYGVIPMVAAQLDLIQKIRRQASGPDNRALLAVQARYAESLGWLYQDAAEWRAAQHWLDRSLEWAHMADDTTWAAFTLARKSQLAGDMHDPGDAVDLAEAAARLAGDGHLRAAGAVYQAHGHALAGDERGALRALDTAQETIIRPDQDPDDPWTPWLTEGYVAAQRARCASLLGDHETAAGLFSETLKGMSPDLRRDRGVYAARLAVSCAEAGDADRAAASGMRALGIFEVTRSGRIGLELRRLDVLLRNWKTRPACAEFREAFAASEPPRR